MADRLVVAFGLLALAGCGREGEPAAASAAEEATARARPRAGPLRFDEVAQLGTHNAYWVDRGVGGDLFGSGVGERLIDQLAYERVRSIELDIHRDEARAGELRVYHTRPGNGLCDGLRDCLGELRAFTWAAPRHDPITVILELKELFGSNFDAAHAIEDLDRLVREELGTSLYPPAELLARCPGEDTLSGCVARAGWPTVDALRGRVLVALLGNWDELGAQATVDWARYAAGPIAARAAFPMASSWKLRADALPSRLAAQVSQADLDRALAQSVLLQVEVLDDPRLRPFLAAGGVVRADGAEGALAQEQRLALGVQVLQTDTPWERARDGGPARALLSLRTSEEVAPEPGRRLRVRGEPGEAVFASREDAGPLRLAAIVSAGHAATVGCLRAAASAGPDAITICRGKLAAERVFVEVEVCRGGACEVHRDMSVEPGPGGVGDLVALVEDGAGCVRARSARTVDRATREPDYVDVGAPWCDAPPLPRRGVYVPATAVGGTVGFFGLAGEGAFTVRVRDGAGEREEPARLVDASAP